MNEDSTAEPAPRIKQRATCPDCAAANGEPHHEQCDVARCLWTGAQRLACTAYDRTTRSIDHDCGQDTWTGTWPGDEYAARLGFWCRWDNGWQPTSADDPNALPNLNRLYTDATWNREERRWDPKPTQP
ncbi:hypothetical protein GCM10023196_036490 [Actinoallomurus vinaceus]|uniref:Uncharacterized protein n=1 Tax=Actinoallomurus vinaceus TaxID=1080074 RepID=A0ABP8UAX2_9ACTN